MNASHRRTSRQQAEGKGEGKDPPHQRPLPGPAGRKGPTLILHNPTKRRREHFQVVTERMQRHGHGAVQATLARRQDTKASSQVARLETNHRSATNPSSGPRNSRKPADNNTKRTIWRSQGPRAKGNPAAEKGRPHGILQEVAGHLTTTDDESHRCDNLATFRRGLRRGRRRTKRDQTESYRGQRSRRQQPEVPPPPGQEAAGPEGQPSGKEGAASLNE